MKDDKEKVSQEEFSVSGEEVVKKVKELLKAGNARAVCFWRLKPAINGKWFTTAMAVLIAQK